MPAVWTEIDLGLPSGGAYYPADVALAPEGGLAYVLSSCTLDPYSGGTESKACISLLDLETKQVLHTAEVPGGYLGRLLLANDVLYLHYSSPGELYALDRADLASGSARARRVDSVGSQDALQAVALDGQGTLYAIGPEEIMRLFPNPRAVSLKTAIGEPLWESETPVAMAATPGGQALPAQVFVLTYVSLQVWNTDLTFVTRLNLKEQSPRSLAFDAGRGWLYVGCATDLYVLDVRTRQWIKGPPAGGGGNPLLQGAQQMVLDPDGNHLYARTQRMTDWFGGMGVVAVDLSSAGDPSAWSVQALYSTFEGWLFGPVLDPERKQLLLASYHDHALIPVSLATGVEPWIPLGLELSEVIVDEASDRLYISDSSGWVRALDRRTYQELGRAYGGRSISLDAAHNRLYAGDVRQPGVSVLAADTLKLERMIPQPGKPRANPAAGQVVIVGRSFDVFDGASGEPAGKLLPAVGEPAPECPSCYYTIAREVIVDAVRGLTATVTYTPWPGKPGPSESIVYEPASGRTYYSLLTGGYVYYSSIASYRDLGELQARRDPILYLEGLSGQIQLDPTARRLYVARSNMLFVLDSENLHRIGRIYTDGWTPAIVAVDGELGRLYSLRGDMLVVWAREGGAPPTLLPPEPQVVTGTVKALLPSPNFGQDQTLLATINERLCRSTDGGKTWVRLRGGLPELGSYAHTVNAVFSPNYAEDRTVWAGVYLGETHGEGVYRSTDGGQTWEMAADGLYDQRVYRVFPSPRYAQDHTLLAYARTQHGEALYRSTNAGDSWQLVVRQTSSGTPPLPSHAQLFPGFKWPPSFRCDYQGVCQRSDDGGETWTAFQTGRVKLDHLVGYALSPRYEEDGIVYLITEANLYRYEERGKLWFSSTDPLFGNRDYKNALSSLAVATAGDGKQMLFIGSNAGEFLVLTAQELPWSEVKVSIPPTPTPTPTPCAAGIDQQFGLDPSTARALEPRLGCATQPAGEMTMAFQPFERGVMFWRLDERRIYVLRRDGDAAAGSYAVYEDTWLEGQPDRDPNLVPPGGRHQPVRGFGKVWREQLGGKDAEIGWATDQEVGFVNLLQPFERGLLIRTDDDTLYLLYQDGNWESK